MLEAEVTLVDALAILDGTFSDRPLRCPSQRSSTFICIELAFAEQLVFSYEIDCFLSVLHGKITVQKGRQDSGAHFRFNVLELALLPLD